MKKYLLISALLLLWCGTLAAQDAQTILQRYNKIVGTDQIKKENFSARIDMSLSTSGIQMTIVSIIQSPDKMRMEMNAMGQHILMIANGKQGWVQVPGLPVQSLPESELEKIHAQGNPVLSWSADEYDLKLLEPATQNDALCDVVEMTAKKSNAPISHQTVYFDRQSGLAVRCDIEMASAKMEILLKDYTTTGKTLYPACIESRTQDVVSVVRINEYQLNYPVNDEMFIIQ